MKKKMISKLNDPDMQAAPEAMLRASKRAREIARQTGTAIVFMRDGKLVKEYPNKKKKQKGTGIVNSE